MQNPAKNIQHLEACIAICTSDCDTVLDLGCGFGDKLAVCPCFCREGVDIYAPYIQKAKKRWGLRLGCLTVDDALNFVKKSRQQKKKNVWNVWDAIMLIDFIEHPPKKIGEELLSICKELATRRIIVYCPEGDYSQTEDLYGLGGEKWQTHQSAWKFEDFEKRGFEVVRWQNRHGPGKHALFSIWSPF